VGSAGSVCRKLKCLQCWWEINLFENFHIQHKYSIYVGLQLVVCRNMFGIILSLRKLKKYKNNWNKNWYNSYFIFLTLPYSKHLSCETMTYHLKIWNLVITLSLLKSYYKKWIPRLSFREHFSFDHSAQWNSEIPISVLFFRLYELFQAKFSAWCERQWFRYGWDSVALCGWLLSGGTSFPLSVGFPVNCRSFEPLWPPPTFGVWESLN